jgi:hypothetical protein
MRGDGFTEFQIRERDEKDQEGDLPVGAWQEGIAVDHAINQPFLQEVLMVHS